MENIGEKIKGLRKSKNFSQEDLAYELGVSRQTIVKWEANKANPSTENINLLCTLFCVSSDFFLIGELHKEGELASSTIVQTNLDIKDESHNKHGISKTEIGPIISSVIFGIIFLICLTFTIMSGKAIFSPNIGDVVVRNDKIEKYYFIISLISLIFSFFSETVIIIFVIKRRNVN